MIIWVAYNEYGDLVIDADNENDLLRALYACGVDEDEVIIARVTA